MLLVAEAQLTIPAQELLLITNLDSDPALAALFEAFDEANPPPSLVEEAAMYAAWIVRHRPFPDDNQKIGYRFMCAMLDDAEEPWEVSQEDAFVIPAVFKALEAGTISDAEFVDWACLRVAAEPLRGPTA
jgi:prophage maintenance system killer protein